MTHGLQNLHRPRLLIRAARFGLTGYRRGRDLKRLIPTERMPSPARAVEILLDQEAEIEASRTSQYATYKVADHVGILIALMAEAQLADACTAKPRLETKAARPPLPANVIRLAARSRPQLMVSGSSDLRRAT